MSGKISDPGYEMIPTPPRESSQGRDSVTSNPAAPATPSMIHMAVISDRKSSSPSASSTPGYQRRASVVVIEHVEVSDVDGVGVGGQPGLAGREPVGTIVDSEANVTVNARQQEPAEEVSNHIFV